MVISVAIAFVVVAWILSGQLGNGNANVPDANNGVAEERLAEVTVRTMHAKAHAPEIVVRGRTEAVRTVNVKSETSGAVVNLPVEKGAAVKAGDILCELSVDARGAQMTEAEAVMQQRKLEYEGAKKLRLKDFRSETQEAASLAAYEAALARSKAATLELERTKIRAPFDGTVDDRLVEIGDFVRTGDICARVVDDNPMLIVGQVSEKDVVQLKSGMIGVAKLITGVEIEGVIRFISRSADGATRTFRVELEVPNPSGLLRDGITSEIAIPMTAVQAHLVSSAILDLGNGVNEVGIRIVDADGFVRYKTVTPISDGLDGVWIAGLPEVVTVITIGHQFVTPGQKVIAREATAGAQF
jgi:multidrug efflux system membrane fusion protein